MLDVDGTVFGIEGGGEGVFYLHDVVPSMAGAGIVAVGAGAPHGFAVDYLGGNRDGAVNPCPNDMRHTPIVRVSDLEQKSSIRHGIYAHEMLRLNAGEGAEIVGGIVRTCEEGRIVGRGYDAQDCIVDLQAIFSALHLDAKRIVAIGQCIYLEGENTSEQVSHRHRGWVYGNRNGQTFDRACKLIAIYVATCNLDVKRKIVSNARLCNGHAIVLDGIGEIVDTGATVVILLIFAASYEEQRQQQYVPNVFHYLKLWYFNVGIGNWAPGIWNECQINDTAPHISVRLYRYTMNNLFSSF